MNSVQIQALIELINEIVNSKDMTWQEKHTAITEQMSESDEANFSEFMSWFDA